MKCLDGKLGIGLFVLLPGVSAVLAQGSAAAKPVANSAMHRLDSSLTAPAVREIDDPHTGARWLLMKDAAHPGGPGRLVQLELGGDSSISQSSQAERPIAIPVIHTGDRVRVEEHTARVDATLESVALGPALAGQPLRVRLKVGGRLVNVIAVGPGQASLAAETGARP